MKKVYWCPTCDRYLTTDGYLVELTAFEFVILTNGIADKKIQIKEEICSDCQQGIE